MCTGALKTVAKPTENVVKNTGKFAEDAVNTTVKRTGETIAPVVSGVGDVTNNFAAPAANSLNQFNNWLVNTLGLSSAASKAVSSGRNDSTAEDKAAEDAPKSPDAPEDELGALGRLLAMRRQLGGGKGIRASIMTSGSGLTGSANTRRRTLGA